MAILLVIAMADISQIEVAPPRIRGSLASMAQWMIGLGIMVAVSCYRSISLLIRLTFFSNGLATAAPTTRMTFHGGFHYHSRLFQPLSSLVAPGFSQSRRAGLSKPAERQQVGQY